MVTLFHKTNCYYTITLHLTPSLQVEVPRNLGVKTTKEAGRRGEFQIMLITHLLIIANYR